jgi:hypothetical protein
MQKALAFGERFLHNARMRTHTDIIRAAGVQTVCDLTGKPYSSVASWGQRNSIPSEYWAALIGAGHATADELIVAAAQKAA